MQKRVKIQLSSNIKKQLESLLRAGKSQVREVFRARIILLASEGKSHWAIMKELNTTLATIRKWTDRFIRNPTIRSLEDASRPGRPFLVPSTAKCEVMKYACSDVKDILPEANTWTIKNLQDCVKQQTGTSISKSEVSRILNHKDLRPHKVKMWLHSSDPLFKEKVNIIASLYLNPRKDAIILCVDEKSGMQAIERKRSIAINGKLRLDHEYKRHGTQTLIAAFNTNTGNVFGRVGKTRKKEDIMEFMEELAKIYPDVDIYIIWDNLNIHHGERWNEFNERQQGRFHFVYTPIHGSWVNQIEIWFGILHRKVLKNNSFKSEENLKCQVEKYIKRWNQTESHPFKWQFRGYHDKAA